MGGSADDGVNVRSVPKLPNVKNSEPAQFGVHSDDWTPQCAFQSGLGDRFESLFFAFGSKGTLVHIQCHPPNHPPHRPRPPFSLFFLTIPTFYDRELHVEHYDSTIECFPPATHTKRA